MKQVIDGKVYNTETATLIAEDSYGFPRDFHHWEESLYITKKGAYFIAGSGGPMTKYAVSVGNNSTSGSSRIEPLSKEEALTWLESHGSAEDIEKYFPEMIKEA